MNNLSNNDIKIATKFLENITGSLAQILSEKTDSEIFKELKCSISSAIFADNLEKFKQGNALYKFGYKVEDIEGSFIILVPEEFIAVISSLIMGDDGNITYKGTLSELETNASLNLFSNIIEDIQITFKSFYFKEFQITSKPQIFAKELPEYNKILSSKDFNFAFTSSLKTADKEFEIFIITESKSLKDVLMDLRLIEEVIAPAPVISSKPAMESPIRKLADVKIDIMAELGRATIPIKNVMSLTKGSILELDTFTDSDIKIMANNLEVARAQIVVVDEYFGIKITKILNPEERNKEI